MNFVDIIIILILVSSLVRGIELGVARQVCSTAGILAGLFAGVFIQSKLVHLMHTPPSKAMLALAVIVGCIALFSSLGELLGTWVRRHIDRINLHPLNVLDRSFGAVVSGATLLLAIWLGATTFSSIPSGGLQRQIKGSVIIAQLNKNLPPAPQLVARLGHLIHPNGFPDVFTGLEPSIDTNKPLPSIGELDGAVQKARASTVKIQGEGCGGISQGSGFVADTNLVITNAHVVAGVENPYILDGAGKHAAQVILFDPELDMAVLRSTQLAGPPLHMSGGIVENGNAAAILGYPGGGDFSAHPAVIVDAFKAIGRDIYNQGETSREVYSIKGDVRPGNSGGPLVDKNGNVIGLIFAESTTYDNVGYALTMDAVVNNLSQAKMSNAPVGTGSCTQ